MPNRRLTNWKKTLAKDSFTVGERMPRKGHPFFYFHTFEKFVIVQLSQQRRQPLSNGKVKGV
jgi:hypothetical protein